MFHFSTASTQPSIRWVPGSIRTGIKRPGREADHSPPSSTEVKNNEAIPPLSGTSSRRGAYLIKNRDNRTFLYGRKIFSKLDWREVGRGLFKCTILASGGTEKYHEETVTVTSLTQLIERSCSVGFIRLSTGTSSDLF
jgi:hypothetical protein